MTQTPSAVPTPAPVRRGAQRTLSAVQVMVAVIVTLTDGAGGSYALGHGRGGFVEVELRAAAPSYDTKTTSSTHTSTSKDGGSTDIIGGAGGGGGGYDPNRWFRWLIHHVPQPGRLCSGRIAFGSAEL